MKPEEIKNGEGRTELRLRVGNVDLIATDRGGHWEVHQVTPGPVASFLTREVAEKLLLDVAKAISATLRARAVRVTCPHCGTYPALDRNGLVVHHTRFDATASARKVCPGAGKSAAALANDISKSPEGA